jgi:hypothetical protein
MRLTIDITDQQHQSLKALAALQGKTIKEYALERLLPGDGLAVNVTTKSIGQILDEELAGDCA